jgi:hypothetical protein
MENIIEEVVVIILQNKTWEPAEKIAALEKQFKMLASMADLQGWNSSKIRENPKENSVDNRAVNLSTYNYGFYDDPLAMDKLTAEVLKLPKEEIKSIGKTMQKIAKEISEGTHENITTEEVQNNIKRVLNKYKTLENEKYPISEEEYEANLLEGEYLEIDDIKKEP